LRPGERRPRHAGRTGCRILRAVAWHAPGDGGGVRRDPGGLMARPGGKRRGGRKPMATRGRKAAAGAGLRLRRVLAWALAAIAVVFLALQTWYFGHVLWWTRFDPGSTAFMRAELHRLREKNPDATIDFRWVPYED